MPWESKSVEEIRKEFVLAARDSTNFSSLCREFGISRKTGYKWVERFAETGGLSDRSRAPQTVANKTNAETEKLILQMRTDNPGWGAKKIKSVLEKQGYDMPCSKTVNNILSRNGCISSEESLKHKPYIRFEKENCNDMWQCDFKGEFKMLDGNYCYPLDIFDDRSRFIIKIKPVDSTANIVIPTFKEAFYEFGVPNSVLSDNGAQFSGFKRGYTQFEKWLMNHNVLPVHGRIKHPQTQGKIERFHRAMKQELLNHYTPENIADARIMLEQWRAKYNNIRPHEALGMKCPADVYTRSTIEYSDRVEKYEYGGQFHVIKVNSWGYVRFDKFQIYLSETMSGEYIEFRPNPHGDSFIGCYRNFAIAEFDSSSGSLVHRSISRL